MINKFNFYEIVSVVSKSEKLHDHYGKEGTILGMAENDDGTWGYAVFFGDITCDIEENALISTGKFSNRESFYSDENIVKVIVDDTGKGTLK